ncbi:MAG: hypothetical protein HY683_04925 [Chloroflexi bacterium]|nr:hypothetical protein [Chloroflexota bacterium]
MEEAEQVQNQARARFIAVCRQHCPSCEPEESWKAFNEKLLVPLVRELGARTYEILSSTQKSFVGNIAFEEFFRMFPENQQDNLRTAILAFLDPKNDVVRTFMLGYLNSYFFMESASLDTSALDALARVKPSFTLFLDTNFVFSILGLHDNPSNAAAISLLRLLNTLPPSVTERLYVCPMTLEETRAVLSANSASLEQVEGTPDMARAVLNTSTLSGLARKFFQEVVNAGQTIRAKDYFEPYINNLKQILRSKGVELYNENPDRLKQNQAVIDDALQLREYEVTTYGPRAKSYEAILHDVVLWHSVRTRRPQLVESPLEAGYWVVTVDYRFIRFDLWKRRQQTNEPPVCLSPTALIQMLQFWLPRSTELEETIVGSLRLPFLFQHFDPAAERVSIQILQTLARFENVNDLSEETITQVLVNQALRNKIPSAQDTQTKTELVREALVEEDQQLRNALAAAQNRLETLHTEVATKSATLQELQQHLLIQERETSDKTRAIQQLQERLEKQEREKSEAEHLTRVEREARRSLEHRVTELEQDRDREQQRASLRKRVTAFGVWVALSFVAVAILAVFLPDVLSRTTSWSYWRISLLTWAALLVLWLQLVAWRGSASAGLMEHRLFRHFLWAKTRLLGAIGLVTLTVIGTIAYELLK